VSRFPSAPCRARGCREGRASRCASLYGRVLIIIAAAAFAAGCGAKAKAATDLGIPPLVMPVPPKHTLPEVEQPPLRATAAPEGALTTEAPAVKPQPTTRRSSEAELKPEPAANAAAPATASAAGPPEPARELRSGAIADERTMQGKIEDLLKSASGALSQVDTNRLTRNGKQTFNEAKSFIDTSVRMLKERRFDLALINAEKAEKAALSLRR
jgi:hypothetical protein